MKRVSFNDKVDVKYYSKGLEENDSENINSIRSNSDYNYIIGLIIACLCVFFIIYLTI